MRIILLLVLIAVILGCDKLPWSHKKMYPIQSAKQVTNLREIRTIKDIQLALKRWDYYKGPVNGRSSLALTHAIKEFQKDNGLAADGEVGAKTRARLKELAVNKSVKE